MKKVFRKKKTVVMLLVTVLLLVSWLVYSRPVTLSQLCPLLPLGECVGISGYYRTSDQTGGLTQFTVEAGSEEFRELCRLFGEKTYRRSLKDLLPRGTRIHQTTGKFEFQWEVWFHFDTVEFPDGNAGSGPLLQVQYWYGELDIKNRGFEEDIRSCHTTEQDTWAKEILDIIT